MTNQTSSSSKIIEEDVAQYRNTSLIEIRIDKGYLKSIIEDYKRSLRGFCGIYGSLGIFLSLMLPIFTSDFKSFWKIDGDLIKTIVIFMAILFGILTVASCAAHVRNRKRLKVELVLSRIVGDHD